MVSSKYWDRRGYHQVEFDDSLKFTGDYAVVGVSFSASENEDERIAKGIIDKEGTFVIGPALCYKKIDILKDGSVLVLTNSVHHFDIKNGDDGYISKREYDGYTVINNSYVTFSKMNGRRVACDFYNLSSKKIVYSSGSISSHNFDDSLFKNETVVPIGRENETKKEYAPSMKKRLCFLRRK